MISGKVWGTTCEVIKKNNVEIHRIHINAGGYCSKHKHNHKHNAFYVESGHLKVRVWKNAYSLVDEVTVMPGMLTSVAPGEYHQFEAVTNCVAYEIYWVEMEGTDIERESTGGLRK